MATLHAVTNTQISVEAITTENGTDLIRTVLLQQRQLRVTESPPTLTCELCLTAVTVQKLGCKLAGLETTRKNGNSGW